MNPRDLAINARKAAHHIRSGGSISDMLEKARRSAVDQRRRLEQVQHSGDGLVWSIEEMSQFRGDATVHGWAFVPGETVTSLRLLLPDGVPVPVESRLASPDVAGVHGPDASACRFSFHGSLPAGRFADELILEVTTAETTRSVDHLHHSPISRDPYHDLEADFFGQLAALTSGSVLEIGSRSRSGNVRHERVPESLDYVGMDIVKGPNVDLVGDAHQLSSLVGDRQFDAVFAVSVFEHLLMPWKVAVEINRVLRPGGIVMIGTHQAFPLHDTPWDYWRFSNESWIGLFNEATGFEIQRTEMGERAFIVPEVCHPITRETPQWPAFIASGVIARKTAETSMKWDVDVRAIARGNYPH